MDMFLGSMCFFAVMGLLYLIDDIRQIATGTVSGLPFLMPILFAVMIGMVLYIKQRLT